MPPKEKEKSDHSLDDYRNLYRKLDTQRLLLNSADQSIVSGGTSATVINFNMKGIEFSVTSSNHTFIHFLNEVSNDKFDSFLNKMIDAQDVVTLARGGGTIYTKDEDTMSEGLISIGDYCKLLLTKFGDETINNLIENGSKQALKILSNKFLLLGSIIKEGELVSVPKIKKIV